MFPVTLLSLAKRFDGLTERKGEEDNPAIVAMLQLVAKWVHHDETAWCSAFIYTLAHLLDLPRPEKKIALAARSWLTVGTPVPLSQARPGFDVVILQRGKSPQPGPDVLSAQGHVGLYESIQAGGVMVFAGNQSKDGHDSINSMVFGITRVLGVRRLWSPS